MESKICEFCQTEDAIWMWEYEPNCFSAVCECCRRAIMEAETKKEREHTRFILLAEYYAIEELENGCQGHRLG